MLILYEGAGLPNKLPIFILGSENGIKAVKTSPNPQTDASDLIQ
jgi:hypothetical protein